MTKSAIEWTEWTWNPIVGCSIVSPGCINCYAMRRARQLQSAAEKSNGVQAGHYAGMTRVVNCRPVWTGVIRIAEHKLTEPLQRKKPTVYFVNSMSDLHHEAVPIEAVDRCVAVMVRTQQHVYQILTKRAERQRAYWSDPEMPRRVGAIVASEHNGDTAARAHAHAACMQMLRKPLANVWLGISAERQKEFDERWPHLRDTPAAVTFVSMEPLLGPIFFRPAKPDWIIVGGESQNGARPMCPDWARDIRDQCAASDVKFFFKQWGEWLPSPDHLNFVDGEAWARRLGCGPDRIEQHSNGYTFARVGKKVAGRLLDGREHDDRPEVRL